MTWQRGAKLHADRLWEALSQYQRLMRLSGAERRQGFKRVIFVHAYLVFSDFDAVKEIRGGSGIRSPLLSLFESIAQLAEQSLYIPFFFCPSLFFFCLCLKHHLTERGVPEGVDSRELSRDELGSTLLDHGWG